MQEEDFRTWFVRLVESYELDFSKATEVLKKILEILCEENADE